MLAILKIIFCVIGTVFSLLSNVGDKLGCVICAPILLCILLLITQEGNPMGLGDRPSLKIILVFLVLYSYY